MWPLLKTLSIVSLVLMSILSFNATRAPALLAQTRTPIQGTITGMNTTEDPPLFTVTTDDGASYRLRAPNFSSVAGAQLGSRFRAAGSMVDGTFVATFMQVADAGASLPPVPIEGGQSGVITGADTESNPPRLLVSVGGGSPLLLTLPGQDRASDIQLGATISFPRAPAGDAFQVNEWVILSYPNPNDNVDTAANDNF